MNKLTFYKVFYDWIELVGLARDKAAMNEFRTLTTAYKNDPDKWNKIYTYDTLNKGWFYLDGTKKEPFIKRT